VVVRSGRGADEILNYERGLSKLKGAAEKALEFANEAADEKEQQYHIDVYNEYVGLLKHQAASVLNGLDPSDEQGLYAKQMLEDLGVDTGTLYRQKDETTGTERAYVAPSDIEPETSYSTHDELDPRAVLPPIPASKRKKK
jgi:hypothetical protein